MEGFQDKASRLAGHYFKASKVLALSGAGFVLFLMFYITADVAGRYLANRPVPASLQISETLMVFIAYLGLAYGQARGIHIRIEFLAQRLKPRWQAIFDIFGLLIGFVLIGLMIWANWGWAWESWRAKDSMQGAISIPYYPSKFGLVLALFFLWVQYGIDLIRRISQLLSSKGR